MSAWLCKILCINVMIDLEYEKWYEWRIGVMAKPQSEPKVRLAMLEDAGQARCGCHTFRQDLRAPDWRSQPRLSELPLATCSIPRLHHHVSRYCDRTAPPAAAMSSSIETEILNKYNLTTLYPATWPQEKDEADEEDTFDEPIPKATKQSIRRSKSRYSVLEPSARFSRQVPGAERSKDGVETLVQKDEQDPLGMYPSVVQVLRAKNIQVEDDIKLRTSQSYSNTYKACLMDTQAIASS